MTAAGDVLAAAILLDILKVDISTVSITAAGDVLAAGILITAAIRRLTSHIWFRFFYGTKKTKQNKAKIENGRQERSKTEDKKDLKRKTRKI